jgi:hypothetical protein
MNEAQPPPPPALTLTLTWASTEAKQTWRKSVDLPPTRQNRDFSLADGSRRLLGKQTTTPIIERLRYFQEQRGEPQPRL